MSRFNVASMLFLAACVGAAGAQVFARQKPDDPPAAADAGPARAPASPWRYQMVRLIHESQLAEKANDEALKGWEVVQVVPVLNGISGTINTQYTILFRRAAGVKD